MNKERINCEEDFLVYLEDFRPEVQEEILKFLKLKDASEGNYDVFPITTITHQENPEEEE